MNYRVSSCHWRPCTDGFLVSGLVAWHYDNNIMHASVVCHFTIFHRLKSRVGCVFHIQTYRSLCNLCDQHFSIFMCMQNHPPTVSFLLCYNQLSAPGASDIWKLALQDGYALSLFRDETLPVHAIYEKLLGDSKNKE